MERASLDQPEVCATLIAPRDRAELAEDLTALELAPMSPARRAAPERFGDAVRRRNRAWTNGMRWR